jgi:precorrin-2/cobalt-factor-2 C20-methyltransferase
MVLRSESFVVLPATLAHEPLRTRLAQADAAAILKLGRHLPKVRQVLTELGLLARAIYVERVSTGQERVMRLTDLTEAEAPYFALVLLPRTAERDR